MGLPYAAIAASLNASLNVGCGYRQLVNVEREVKTEGTYMSMCCPANVLRTSTIFHREYSFRDHLPSVGT